MRYRTLGLSGTVVSTYALGAMTFGAESDEATSHAMIDQYVAAGGNLIDTADVYGRGRSEEIVGRWLASRHSDARGVVIATKARMAMGPGPNDLGLSRFHLQRALDDSLRRLGIEQIDLYQMHAWDPLTPLEETLHFLDDAVRAGKIAYYGFSNFLGWQLTKAVHVARALNLAAPVTVQSQYNLLVREIESELVPAAQDAGLGLLTWSPLAGGWLTGKYRRDTRPAGATRLGENPTRPMESWERRSSLDQTWAVIEALSDVAGHAGHDLAQVALAWVESRPAVTSVILGARDPQQLATNLRAVDITLSPEHTSRLDLVSAPAVADYPYGTAGARQRSRSLPQA